MNIIKFNNYLKEDVNTDPADLNKLFLQFIFQVADSSVARRLKVGCVFVKNSSIVSMGYNHTPFDQDPNCQVQQDDGTLVSKPWIYFDEKKEGVIHAEVDALRRMKLNNINPVGCSVYVTDMCCADCAKALVDAKVKEVFYVRPYRITTGVDLLNNSGIPTSQVSI